MTADTNTPESPPARRRAELPVDDAPEYKFYDWRRLRDWLWGYDFFISYHWGSGGSYAVALAQRLRDRRYDVFLDRGAFAMGDNWRTVGTYAIRNTKRLVLVATREAITESDPVAYEVTAFRSRGRQVIPIIFNDRTERIGLESIFGLGRDKSPILFRISDMQLYIREDADRLMKGPSERAVDELAKTSTIMRRRDLRSLFVLGIVTALAAFGAFATFSWGSTWLAKVEAEQSAIRERNAKTEEERQRVEAEKQRNHAVQEAIRSKRLAYDADMRTLPGLHDKGKEYTFESIILSWEYPGDNIDYYGFEWYYWNSQHTPHDFVERKPLLFGAPGCLVKDVAFGRDATRVGYAGEDGIVRVWDFQRNEDVLISKTHGSPATSVAFDNLVAAGYEDGSVRIWDLSSQDGDGRLLGRHVGPVVSLAFRAGSYWLASVGAEGICNVWDCSSRRRLASFAVSPVKDRVHQPYGVALDPDDDRNYQLFGVAFDPREGSLAIASEDSVYLSDVYQNARCARVSMPKGGELHLGPFLAVSIDRKNGLIAASNGVNLIGIWDSEGHPRYTLRGHSGLVSGLSFDGDGARLASIDVNGTIMLWDMATGRDVLTLDSGRSSPRNKVILDPTGKTLVSTVANGTLKSW